MTKRTGPTNPVMKTAIDSLRKKGEKDSPFWDYVAKKLSDPTRSKVEVNISEINRHAKGNETIIVPGTVLASGTIDKPVTIAAWRFSGEAEKKIRGTGGTIMTFEELKKKNPKGTDVKIMV